MLSETDRQKKRQMLHGISLTCGISKKKKKKGQTQRNRVGNWLSGAGKWGNRETLVKDDE